MWAFILLMVWIICFGTIKTSDKICNGISNSLDKQANEEFNKYSVTGSDLEDIDYKFRTVKNKEFKETKDEIRIEIGVEPNYDQIKWGYFAKKGKIPDKSEMQTSSIFDSVPNNTGRICDKLWIGLFYEEKCCAHLKFLKWYDRTLRDNGFPYELMYATRKDGFFAHTRDAKPISECTDIRRTIAFWKPFARLTAFIAD